MAKVTPRKQMMGRDQITVKTKDGSGKPIPSKWWKARTKEEKLNQFLGTVTFLKEQNQMRYRQANIFSKLYGNLPLFGNIGSHMNKMGPGNQLPIDRPTMSVITSAVDTLVSSITQERPRPEFLTDGSDYRQRNMAKQLNTFINGEFYQADAYDLGKQILRDACVFGTGALKILEDLSHKVCLERVLPIDLLVDSNETMVSSPRQLYQLKLVDRDVLDEMFPSDSRIINDAQQSYPTAGQDESKAISDLVMVAEGWHLPSGPDAKDGRHYIACSSGELLDEAYEDEDFPFVFLHYAPRQVGFWGQGIPERLMGTQIEINKLLVTISQSINLVGVPRIFVEDGSKIVKAHLNNAIGSIVTYRGTPPVYSVAPCVPQELYAQLQRLIDYAYQQEGISQLSASSLKPAGLNSGAALREYLDTQSARFADLNKRYADLYKDIAYQMIEKAKSICEETGKYQTIYPGKNGTKRIDLPEIDLLQESYVIQCFDTSSLPRDPAGRLQKITEMMQAGLIDPQEGRRLLDYPDIEQVDKLANASEERILQILDNIVEKGEFSPPDPFMDLNRAKELVVQYYNLYESAKLEEDKCQKLRDFFSQVNALIQAAMPPPMAPPGINPQAAPMPAPTSDIIPNIRGAA